MPGKPRRIGPGLAQAVECRDADRKLTFRLGISDDPVELRSDRGEAARHLFSRRQRRLDAGEARGRHGHRLRGRQAETFRPMPMQRAQRQAMPRAISDSVAPPSSALLMILMLVFEQIWQRRPTRQPP